MIGIKRLMKETEHPLPAKLLKKSPTKDNHDASDALKSITDKQQYLPDKVPALETHQLTIDKDDVSLPTLRKMASEIVNDIVDEIIRNV